jgi:hypothetical protein
VILNKHVPCDALFNDPEIKGGDDKFIYSAIGFKIIFILDDHGATYIIISKLILGFGLKILSFDDYGY